MSKQIVRPHTPRAHEGHANTDCGCITDIYSTDHLRALCKYCGAMYDYMNAAEFFFFRCYDCGASIPTGPPTGERYKINQDDKGPYIVVDKGG